MEPLTIPLAELFLTKAQIVQMNRKDVLDLLALLLDHEVGPGDAETINSDVHRGPVRQGLGPVHHHLHDARNLLKQRRGASSWSRAQRADRSPAASTSCKR